MALAPSGTLHDPFRMDQDRPGFTPDPPKISGYRVLSTAEADLINSIKAEGVHLQGLLEVVAKHLSDQSTAAVRPGDGSPDEIRRIDQAQPYKWTAVAQTHFQQGLMALTRAVAQPRGF